MPKREKVNNKVMKLAEGILLHVEEREGPPASYSYSLELKIFKKVTLHLNFEDSKNFFIDPSSQIEECDSKMRAVLTADADLASNVIKVVQKNIYQEADLSLRMTCTFEEATPETRLRHLAAFDSEIAKVTAKAEQLYPEEIHTQSRSEIAAVCRRSKASFVDLTFPPCEDGISKTAGLPSPNMAERKAIVWRRPREFCDGKQYALFEGSIEANDIKQGALGDCWLMCALAALAEFPALVRALFPQGFDSYNDDGVYKVRLCVGGEWKDIILDDYFPCVPRGGPIYSQSHNNELWVLLVEKAFAKVSGSYAAIKMGNPVEALMDLTGAPFKEFVFNAPEVDKLIKDGTLWTSIEEWDQEHYLMSLGTRGVDTFTESGGTGSGAHGLVPGHAYTLIAAKTIFTGAQLVQIRNPWGRMEWDGDWSDHSPLWTPELKAELGWKDADDGAFWMGFEDVLKFFSFLSLSMALHPAHGDEPWHEARTRFQYKFQKTGHACISVSKFSFTVTKPTTVFAAIHQADQRRIDALEYIDVGVAVHEVLPNGQRKMVAATRNKVDRQNQLEIKSLPPGTYTIEPTSTGIRIEQLKDKKVAKGLSVCDDDFVRSCVLVVHSSEDFRLSDFDTQEVIHASRAVASGPAIATKVATRPVARAAPEVAPVLHVTESAKPVVEAKAPVEPPKPTPGPIAEPGAAPKAAAPKASSSPQKKKEVKVEYDTDDEDNDATGQKSTPTGNKDCFWSAIYCMF